MYNIIFDYDGVFGDSWEATVGAFMKMNNIDDKEEIENNLRNTRLVYPRYTSTNNSAERNRELGEFRYDEYVNKLAFGTKYFTEFVEVIRSLPAGSRIALVSTAHQLALDQFVRDSGLEFSHVLGFCDDFNKPELVKRIITDWNETNENVVFVTDTIRDVVEIQTILPRSNIIGVGWGFHGYSYLRTVLPDCNIITNSGEFLNTLIKSRNADLSLDDKSFTRLEDDYILTKKSGVVTAIILTPQGILTQKRSPTRKLYPSSWDLPGGHVEENETIINALHREILEETGVKITKIKTLFKVWDWSQSPNEHNKEYTFVVECEIKEAIMEEGKITEFRLATKDNIEYLKENRDPNDTYIYNLISEYLQ
jgi:8-oxo-dGTP diphosphatase